MTARDVTAFALSLPEAVEDHPFGVDTHVYRVARKIFAILQPDQARVSVKCDPGLALVFRDAFEAVTPGWHLNKRHWNTIALDGPISSEDVREMIRHSYDLIVAKLPREDRRRLLVLIQESGLELCKWAR